MAQGESNTSDLSWNEHVNGTVKKASKLLYFPVRLKRARPPYRDLVFFYVTYKINPSLCSVCTLLCSAQVFTM